MIAGMIAGVGIFIIGAVFGATMTIAGREVGKKHGSL